MSNTSFHYTYSDIAIPNLPEEEDHQLATLLFNLTEDIKNGSTFTDQHIFNVTKLAFQNSDFKNKEILELALNKFLIQLNVTKKHVSLEACEDTSQGLPPEIFSQEQTLAPDLNQQEKFTESTNVTDEVEKLPSDNEETVVFFENVFNPRLSVENHQPMHRFAAKSSKYSAEVVNENNSECAAPLTES